MFENLFEVSYRADVVAATCVGAGDAILDGRCFHLCVIDEATQATEPACLIPIIRSGADSLVLVGDPAQLPPTVISQQATEMGLAVSLFEHLQQCGVKPLLLDTQYRYKSFLFSGHN
jgi:regulator of nonsense transcripts 1